MQHLSAFWLRHIHPRVSTLTAAIGGVGLAICLSLLSLVAFLSREVWERDSFAFDKTLLLAIHNGANPLVDRIMLGFTQLGNPDVVVPIFLMSLAFLWAFGWQREAKLFALACCGGTFLSRSMKLFFSRPRPVLWDRLIQDTTFSFPSGHALGSMVLYGFLGYLLTLRFPQHCKLITSLTACLITAIGFSRLYLGVHWVTDVIAGYSIGFLWLTVCITMLKLQRSPRAKQEQLYDRTQQG